MIKLFEPYVNDEARANVMRVLSGKQLAEGPEVKLFEKEFAEKFGFEPWQIVSLNSGTSALELAYELCDIGKKCNCDPKESCSECRKLEVITPVLTCTATNIPLARRKAKIIFADIEGKKTLNIDPEDVRRKIVPYGTKAVVFVHFGGSSEGLEEIERICHDAGIDLICDAAQALGSKLSTEARFNIISLQAIKSLTAGDGGILICKKFDDAVKARKLRWFGYDRELKQKLGDTDLELAGYKMHMNDISAAIARGNLSEWDRIYDHRNAINNVYESYGAGKGFIRGIWNPQVVGMKFEAIRAKLEGIAEVGQYHYPNSKYSIFPDADCPVMDSLVDSYFMLPCHMGMTVVDAKIIAETIWPKN